MDCFMGASSGEAGAPVPLRHACGSMVGAGGFSMTWPGFILRDEGEFHEVTDL